LPVRLFRQIKASKRRTISWY